jgi:hypothetical protein
VQNGNSSQHNVQEFNNHLVFAAGLLALMFQQLLFATKDFFN